MPEATAILAPENDDKISFVDAAGRVIATFRRRDVSMYVQDAELPDPPETSGCS